MTKMPNTMKISVFSSGPIDTLSAYCAVRLPLTTVIFSVVSSLVTALIMFCAGKRRRRRRCNEELVETRPIYEIPHFPTKSNAEMELKENVCYGSKCTQSASSVPIEDQ